MLKHYSEKKRKERKERGIVHKPNQHTFSLSIICIESSFSYIPNDQDSGGPFSLFSQQLFFIP